MRFELLVDLSSLVLAAALTGTVRSLALSHGVLDQPNERSSHRKTMPRGGGASIVLVVSAASIVLALRGVLGQHLALVLLVGGIAVGTVGFLDDRAALSAGVRLAVHFGAAIWAVIWIGGMPPLQIGGRLVAFGWPGDVAAVLGIVWTLNLFNFMDGIDGIAASEAAFIGCAGALVSLLGGATAEGPNVAVVLAAACIGFLLWNWPPARIFMGDVGSGYLGYVIAVLALYTAHSDPIALWVWLILGGVFFVDATVTLLRRLVRRERVFEAHRSHAYQWLARRWTSHRRVTLSVLVLNVVWLLPCAFGATLRPDHALAIATLALAPVVGLAFIAGSGRSEASCGSGMSGS